MTVTLPNSEAELPGWKFLYSPRWIGYFALLVVFSVACVFLGNWQFERRAEARAEIDRIDLNYDAEPVPLAEEVPDRTSFDEDEQKWQQVVVTGEYLDTPVLARNRPGPGTVGSDLIVPFKTTDGQVFFVDRGWVPVDGAQAMSDDISARDKALASLPTSPEGQVLLTARLRASEPEIPGRTSAGMTVASIQSEEVARVTGTAESAYLASYGMLVQEASLDGAPLATEHGTLPARPERDEGPHLSYALQWYVFILIAGIGVTYAARQEYRGLNTGSEKVRLADEVRAEKRRKKVTDADEEDALLGA
ncbi:SURF1 family cytochrome oxidase biogenesis protein [Leucobacter sp. 1207-22]|uniref:SURF1 family cytochrome oxidase biogenesis protein n=1 Tax=Leucobacter sp. 1207-22 TaxID=2604456 RepID=UPI004063DA84